MGELLVAGDWLVVGRGGLLLLLQAGIISVQIEQIVTIKGEESKLLLVLVWLGWGCDCGHHHREDVVGGDRHLEAA